MPQDEETLAERMVIDLQNQLQEQRIKRQKLETLVETLKKEIDVLRQAINKLQREK